MYTRASHSHSNTPTQVPELEEQLRKKEEEYNGLLQEGNRMADRMGKHDVSDDLLLSMEHPCAWRNTAGRREEGGGGRVSN
jgi:hypothetical protein